MAARLDLLEREKQLSRRRDGLAQQRRQLPWVQVDKAYRFDGPTDHGHGHAFRARRSP